MTLIILGTFYAAMVAAGYLVEIIFGGLGLVPSRATARVAVTGAGVSLNYTTWLNIVFLLMAAILVVRFLRTGGVPMLRMMNGPADAHGGHDQHGHDQHGHDQHGHHGVATAEPGQAPD
jgi:hypothetical protein